MVAGGGLEPPCLGQSPTHGVRITLDDLEKQSATCIRLTSILLPVFDRSLGQAKAGSERGLAEAHLLANRLHIDLVRRMDTKISKVRAAFGMLYRLAEAFHDCVEVVVTTTFGGSGFFSHY